MATSTHAEALSDGERMISGKLTLIAILLVILVLTVIAQGLVTFLDRSLTTWQYSIIAPKDEDLEKVMNQAGANGWEVVSTRRVSDGNPVEPKMRFEIMLKKAGVSPAALAAPLR